MQNQYDNIVQLTSSQFLVGDKRRVMLNDFAYEFQWNPSDILDIPLVSDLATAHIIVEHGLENTAVISFLNNSRSYADLSSFEKRRLLSVSYNNLIDWHIHVERNAVTYVFNRTKSPSIVEQSTVSRDNMEKLRSEVFEKLIGKRPNPNIPALDDALIKTISYWKRELSAQTSGNVSNEAISALFNAIIFVRAIEDQKRINTQNIDEKLLLDVLNMSSNRTLWQAITSSLYLLGVHDVPPFLIDEEQLKRFNVVDESISRQLLTQFYRHEHVPYDYNFALMSKHALSRIYEHYVSILSIADQGQQLSLPILPPLPEEERNKTFGSIYTPQYIARFFARYLHSQIPISRFKNIRTIDPAVGSGIFLRTLLEAQFEAVGDLSSELIKEAIQNTFGVDLDENASQATKLSLSLLHLVLTDSLPQSLNIFTAEATEFFESHPELWETYDVVIANPPFVSLDTQDDATRQRISKFMENYASGRIDMYLAFLRMGLELLKPGGYGLFVLPHSFLLAKSAKQMRKLISESAWIRCLADLSAIRVFGSSGIYVILLIFQKKLEPSMNITTPAMVIKCQDLVGKALQDAIEDQRIEGSFYSIYDVEQDLFTRDDWTIPPPTEAKIEEKFSQFPTLDNFLYVRAGFISGADEIFILDSKDVPKGEENLYVSYLPDRDMTSYTVPNNTGLFFFYPYIDKRPITEAELQSDFPKTWQYLSQFRTKLEDRGQVKKGLIPWWRPERPREPKHMMIPKIVTPHLSLVSRFSFDIEGKYAVRRGPLMYPRTQGAESDLLRYFVGILNSTACYWYIASHSHTYRGGYAMLEPKTLNRTPVPNPTSIEPIILRQILDLVDRRINIKFPDSDEAIEIEKTLDQIVADLYGLSIDERRTLGIDKNGSN